MKLIFATIWDYVRWSQLLFAGLGFLIILILKIPGAVYSFFTRTSSTKKNDLFYCTWRDIPELFALLLTCITAMLMTTIFFIAKAIRKMVAWVVSNILLKRLDREQFRKIQTCKSCFAEQPHGVCCIDPDKYCDMVHRVRPRACQTTYREVMDSAVRKTSLVYYL